MSSKHIEETNSCNLTSTHISGIGSPVSPPPSQCFQINFPCPSFQDDAFFDSMDTKGNPHSGLNGLTVSKGSNISYASLDGGRFFGELRNGKRETLGFFIWENGDAYFGNWKDDVPHGKGLLFLAFGGFLEGCFKQGLVNGQALMAFPNGDFYEGSWFKGRHHQEGLKYSSSKNSWKLATYSNGLVSFLIDQGNGKPVSFRTFFCLNIESC